LTIGALGLLLWCFLLIYLFFTPSTQNQPSIFYVLAFPGIPAIVSGYILIVYRLWRK
jgi:hypothetical protein